MEIGQIITDGSTKWVVQDIRDTALVAQIEYHYVLRKGRLKADGSIVNREQYPMLWSYVQENNLAVSSSDWVNNQVMFSTGDGSTTFGLPSLMDKTIWGSNTVRDIKAGLPNLTGTFWTLMYKNFINRNGVFNSHIENAVTTKGVNGAPDFPATWVDFNANSYNSIYGNSNTVQPPAIGLIPQIKYC